VIRFGLFELNLKAGQLSRNGTQLPLPQQPLQLLSVLLERPGEVITREELRRRLWASDVFVDFDHGLNKSIQKLRDALGDSATNPRYIQTIPRVGYSFIAPVRNGIRPLEVEPELEIPRKAPEPPVALAPKTGRKWLLAAAACAVIVIAGTAVYFSSHQHTAVLKYTQLTDFTDSATSPALSPDGHILAFIRGDSPFMSADQIYAKVLPNGEAIRLTNDPRVKYNLAFSPDGSQIAYTVMKPPYFSTYTVAVLGGEPHLLLDNAAGLTWLDQHQFLFSRIRSGLHLGLVTQSLAGDNYRELYFPAHERGMVHYSYASPDRKSALTVEMDGQGAWDMCGLVSLQGNGQRRSVGPEGECTSAGWSRDGSWMYFAAWVEGQSHLWRQRFPNGQPEQITFGPTSEEGLAVDPDGHSVITSVGVYQSAIWIHDDKGERSLSSEGEVANNNSPPSFAADGKTLYYLVWHHPTSTEPELWRLAVDSGRNEAVFPGRFMSDYDVSPDGKQVVYATAPRNGKSQLWLASIDRSSPPKQLGASGETMPHFGPGGKILFRSAEGNANYLEQINQDGSGRSKVVPYPIIEIQGVSPGRKWLMAMVPYPEGNRLSPMPMAIPLNGGPPRRMCESYCVPTWSSGGKFLFIAVEPASQTSPGRSLAIPVGPGETLPDFPPGGIQPGAEPDIVPGSQSVNRGQLVPGEDPSHFAYVNTTAHRNMYRISLP
jgi:DNA-binding winged helix-turn-helix (wHTH) protein/Tol biopolymer transport system component